MFAGAGVVLCCCCCIHSPPGSTVLPTVRTSRRSVEPYGHGSEGWGETSSSESAAPLGLGAARGGGGEWYGPCSMQPQQHAAAAACSSSSSSSSSSSRHSTVYRFLVPPWLERVLQPMSAVSSRRVSVWSHMGPAGTSLCGTPVLTALRAVGGGGAPQAPQQQHQHQL